MSAVSPKEIEEAIKRVNETVAENYNIEEIIDALAKLGIQVKNPDGSFKCWYDIFTEMADVWKTLEDNQIKETSMRERLFDILKEKEQFLLDGETLIFIKNGEMVALYNDGEQLCEVNGEIDKRLKQFLDWLYDENEY